MTAETVANSAFNSLTAGVDFSITLADVSGAAFQTPAATGPLYGAVAHLTNADLTTGVVGGTGTFDVLMNGFKAHLEGEFKANRISGAEYTKAFIALTESAMGGAVQFLLGKEQAYWQALQAQVQAQTLQVALVTARVQLETAKAQLQVAQIEAQAGKANYALTKLKLASEEVQYDTGVFTKDYLLPAQQTLLGKQATMVQEQTEAQRAQTLNTRTDGATVLGLIGKQKDLYAQQVTSYQRDSEMKAAKLFTDAWITMKTMDEGLLPPTGFNNTSLDTVLTHIKTNNSLG